ncbi:Peptidoglycan/xylan/chitin deacetylase, PgdA/CDA1 family [Cyclobacterium xiamenense]|uniref:Peptidoglycan/xylan/chitin deacetylase, PgdA/CDA1 family n=2 Tax=Cyclobacterium xiamenense TaxID=1297121 RepID=A0A1H6WBZ0_9BACT|nr:Peptidoglycan/xylan/chitin deacetylase, PgdA/CDA1 family [Cyclobacterium xiamenense]
MTNGWASPQRLLGVPGIFGMSWLLLLLTVPTVQAQNQYEFGAITRGDRQEKSLSLVFTGHAYAEGAEFIRKALQEQRVPASFFFTGDFYRNPDFNEQIRALQADGHYLGAHSDRHLLYASWDDRNDLLITREQFVADLMANYKELARFGVSMEEAPFFLPPYEWYNDSIALWTQEMGLQLINYTRGTLSHADYTTEDMPNFRSSEAIFDSIRDWESFGAAGFNGFILLVHIGAGPGRADKFYHRLPALLTLMREWGYSWVPLKELLGPIP